MTLPQDLRPCTFWAILSNTGSETIVASPKYTPFFQALSVLADKGVQIYFMHGNRDFLISANYLQQFNISLIDRDSTEVDLHGTKAIIMHGDSLCTDDQDYLAFRSKVRGQAWQAQFLATPVKARLAQMRKLREDSYRATQNKTNQVLDVNRQAVVEQFEQSDAALLIHGHTHRPDVHLLTIGGRPKKRIVLGDWHTHTKVLVCDRNKQELLTWPPG